LNLMSRIRCRTRRALCCCEPSCGCENACGAGCCGANACCEPSCGCP
jgi:hypothetical protein